MAGGWSAQGADDLDDIDTWMANRNANLALQPTAEAAARDLWNQGTLDGEDVSAPNPSDLTNIGLAALGVQGFGFPRPSGDNDDSNGNSEEDDSTEDDAGDETTQEDTDGSTTPTSDSAASAAATPPPQPSDATGPTPSTPPSVSPEVANSTTVDPLTVVGVRPQQQSSEDDGGWRHSTALKFAGGGLAYLAGLPVGALRSVYHAAGDLKDAGLFAANLVTQEGRAQASQDIRQGATTSCSTAEALWLTPRG